MALITVGSLNDFSAQFSTTIQDRPNALRGVHPIGVMSEANASLKKEKVEFPTSKSPRGVALNRIKLSRDFGNFFQHFFDVDHDVYFVAWAWDYSGKPVVQYPPSEVASGSAAITLSAGEVRQFIGAGVPLFVPRQVTSGIALRIQLWESKSDQRKLGETLERVATSIQESSLNSLLSVLASATGVTLATVNLIKEASLELAKVIGTVLKASNDDAVDLFEGYYPVSTQWSSRDETYEGHASEIALRLLSDDA
jgi:hypothetical protein